MRIAYFIFQGQHASAQFKCYLKSCPVEMRIYMNITSVNLTSSAPSSKIMPGDDLPLCEKSEGSKDFKNTLKSLEIKSAQTTAQTEAPQRPDISKNSTTIQLGSPDQKELAAFFEQYLPASTTKSAEKTPDIEPTSVALTTELPVRPLNVDITKSNNTVQQVSPEQNEQITLVEPNQQLLPTEEKIESVDIKPVMLALTDEPTTTDEPNLLSADIAPAQDMSSAMAMNGLTFVKPASEEIKLNPSTENQEADVSLQKTTVFGQPTQSKPGNTLPSANATEPEKSALTAVIESKPGFELEKTAPDVRTEILGIQKPTEVKTDNFAIAKPVTHPGWSKDLGEQIVWMNNKEISAAEIKLNPLHLGPISIRIDVGQDNQTSIQFTAQHAETKEALEASIPKLREMLQGQQLNLVNVNISQNPNSNNSRQSSQAFYGNPGRPETSVDTGVGGLEMHEADAVVSKGLLSLYA